MKTKDTFDKTIQDLAGETVTLLRNLDDTTPEEIAIIAWALGEEIRRAQYKDTKGGGPMLEL